MLSDDGSTPILMDFGSLSRCPIEIKTRSDALAVAELAAQHSTLPYRSPELFEPPVGSQITTKTDIWSLGCTLFACLYLHSPFETEAVGGSISYAVANSSGWKFDDTTRPLNPLTKNLIRSCLQVDPGLRPDVEKFDILLKEAIQDLTEI